MGIFNFLNRKSESVLRYQLVTERGNSAYAWNGKIYESDIIAACLAPYAKAISKLSPKHIRSDYNGGFKVNPEPYMRILLSDPNPLMSMTKLQERITAPLLINGNAYLLIVRDINGYPTELFPLAAVNAEAVYKKSELYLKFTLTNGKQYTFNYDDIIHLRCHLNNNDIFGESIMPALSELMNVIGTIDKGIVKAVKNSNVIKWLLKYETALRSEDIQAEAKKFADNYLDVSNSAVGVAATDAKADVVQVTPKDYVPNYTIMASVVNRIYALFGVNEKIVNSSYNEDEWNSFYELNIEPIALDMQNEFTRKLFTRKERGFGNRIVFEAANLSCASTSTKLQFVGMVDRGAMSTNEWRELFNLGPTDEGNVFIRRLDTAPVSEKGGD